MNEIDLWERKYLSFMEMRTKNPKFIPYQMRHTEETARLYSEAMPEDFVSEFGHKLIHVINKEIVKTDYSYGIVFEEENVLGGYIAYTLNASKLYDRVIKKNFLRLIVIFLLKLFRKPKMLFDYFKTRSLLKKLDKDEILAELIIAGLKPEYRGKGIGKVIYVKAIEDCILSGAKKIKAIIHEEDPRINNLYNSLGFKEYSRFKYRNTTRKMLVFDVDDEESSEIFKNQLIKVNKIENDI